MQILDGATVVGSGTAAANGTYSITTSVLADGSHIIAANVGAAQSQPLTVTVDTQAPASATITAPTNGSTVSGPVTISATTDATGVFGVQFKLNGNVLNAEDTSSPYSTSWDTTTVADGTYSLTATARDAAGNSVTSSAVSVLSVTADPYSRRRASGSRRSVGQRDFEHGQHHQGDAARSSPARLPPARR